MGVMCRPFCQRPIVSGGACLFVVAPRGLVVGGGILLGCCCFIVGFCCCEVS